MNSPFVWQRVAVLWIGGTLCAFALNERKIEFEKKVRGRARGASRMVFIVHFDR